MPFPGMHKQKTMQHYSWQLKPSHAADPETTTSPMHLHIHMAQITGNPNRHTIPSHPQRSTTPTSPATHPIPGTAGLGSTYHGQFSSDWAVTINKIHPNLAKTGEQIMTILLKKIWMYMLDSWKLRNTHLHQAADQINLPN